MGVLEDIDQKIVLLSERVRAHEEHPSPAALLSLQDKLRENQQRLEDEHQALGRRMHAIESESNQAQHGESLALGRRVEKLEGLPTVLESSLQAAEQSLREQLTSLIEAQPAPILAAVTALLEAQQKVMLRHLSPLEDWLRREQAWASQPWWKRWWRRARGERP